MNMTTIYDARWWTYFVRWLNINGHMFRGMLPKGCGGGGAPGGPGGGAWPPGPPRPPGEGRDEGVEMGGSEGTPPPACDAAAAKLAGCNPGNMDWKGCCWWGLVSPNIIITVLEFCLFVCLSLSLTIMSNALVRQHQRGRNVFLGAYGAHLEECCVTTWPARWELSRADLHPLANWMSRWKKNRQY